MISNRKRKDPEISQETAEVPKYRERRKCKIIENEMSMSGSDEKSSRYKWSTGEVRTLLNAYFDLYSHKQTKADGKWKRIAEIVYGREFYNKYVKGDIDTLGNRCKAKIQKLTQGKIKTHINVFEGCRGRFEEMGGNLPDFDRYMEYLGEKARVEEAELKVICKKICGQRDYPVEFGGETPSQNITQPSQYTPSYIQISHPYINNQSGTQYHLHLDLDLDQDLDVDYTPQIAPLKRTSSLTHTIHQYHNSPLSLFNTTDICHGDSLLFKS